MKINRIIAIASIIGAALSVSCTKDTDITPTGMTMDQASVQIHVGQTATLTPEFSPKNASSEIAWTSSDESVATVTGGYVTGVKAGTATITAKTPENVSATCAVTVSNVPASSLVLNMTSLTLYEGENGAQLTAAVEPYNVTFPAVSWTSSNPDVATVDAAGNVSPVALGEADITASLVDGTKSVCKVKVTLRVPTEPETLTFWKTDAAGYRGLFGAAADNGKTAGEDGWLSYVDGVARWTANTTGKPRKATLELSTGSSITIQQVEGKDIAGDYVLYSNAFKPLSNTKTLGTRRMATTVKFVPVENEEELNGHVHNFDIVGLYLEAKLPCSLEITEDGPKVYTYLSLDYQTVSSGIEVAIIPELTNSTTYSTGYFAEQSFGPEACNYAWVGWGVEDIFDPALKVTMGTGAERLVSESRYFCGFSIVKKGYATGSYTTIYQLNYNNIWSYGPTGGAYFEKQ